MASCQGARPGAIPGNRTNLDTPCASLRSRVSKTQHARGSTEAACQFSWGRGRQAMHLPCKQADAGALPAGLHHFKFSAGNSTNAQRAASYAVTGGCDSHSRYQFREVIRPPDCKSGVTKQGRKRRLARYQHFPPFWIRSSIRGATRCLREG